jgi:hypothetical protein
MQRFQAKGVPMKFSDEELAQYKLLQENVPDDMRLETVDRFLATIAARDEQIAGLKKMLGDADRYLATIQFTGTLREQIAAALEEK